MSEFRGVLYGVTEVPGFERPAVDGELCEEDFLEPLTLPSPCRSVPTRFYDAGRWQPMPFPEDET